MNPSDHEPTEGRFRALLERALHGDHDAAWELLEFYGSHLLHLLIVKRREQGDLPVDAVKLVSQAWELLRRETPPKSRRPKRRASSKVRSAASPASPALAPLPAPAPPPSAPPPLPSEQPTVGVATPDLPTLKEPHSPATPASAEDQVSSARQRWKHLTVNSEMNRRIVKLRLKGASFEEIAAELGLAEPVVRRVILSMARQREDQS